MAAPVEQFLRRLLLLIAVYLLRRSTAVVFPKEALPTKSGYLEVNSTTGSAIFYAYYEARNSGIPAAQTPILIWLQGGPGCSSMLGNLFELGPWLVNQDVVLQRNPHSWNEKFALLFIDNPIGSGFSIAASPEEIPRNQFDVAKHLFIAIQEFVALDSGFKARPIYITGESYAGKYLPALGFYILRNNPLLPSEKRVNLAGVAIGNGLTDPEIQISTHALNAFYLGLINDAQRTHLEKLQKEAVQFAREEKWGEAADARTRVLGELTNMTGLATLYDFRRLTPYPNSVVTRFLNTAEAKTAFGVNESLVFSLCSTAVANALHEDIMKSVRHMVEFLVSRTRVLLYQGQCDLRDGVVSTLAWVEEMKWEGIPHFLEAERKVWRVSGELAGYVQKWKNLSHVVVTNAGHLVPTDEPLNSQVMIQDWVSEKGLFAAAN